MTGNFFTELAKGYQKMRAISEIERVSIHRVLAAFYNNDYLLIDEILKTETLNNPFSNDTLLKLHFQHLNITEKIIARVTSGIYTNPPLRELQISEDKTDDNLQTVLNLLKYNQKVKDAFKKAYYYNICLIQPVYDYESKSMRLDVITPDNIEVETKEDYLKIKTIKICKAKSNGEIYHSVWTDSEHYIIEGEGKISPPDNPKGINPFGKLPFTILRMKEGYDFYGEPNWNIFLNQKNLDIRLTDMDLSELKSIMGIFHGINTKFEEGISLSPGKIIQSTEIEGENVSLNPLTLDIDYSQVRDSIDWKLRSVMSSEGLSAQSGDVDPSNESGIKRSIDEIELEEKRDEFKEILYNFEIDLLNNIRMVWNYYKLKPALNPNGSFDMSFSEEKSLETIDDKIKRRRMESEIGYKNKVSFTMEDLEVDEAEAIEILNKISEQNKLINSVDTPADDSNDDNSITPGKADTGEENV